MSISVISTSVRPSSEKAARVSDSTMRRFFADLSSQTGWNLQETRIGPAARCARRELKVSPEQAVDTFVGLGWKTFPSGNPSWIKMARPDGTWPLLLGNPYHDEGKAVLILDDFDSLEDSPEQRKLILSQAAKKILPPGYIVSGDLATWSKQGGHAGADILDRIADKASKLGFKERKQVPFSSPDGSTVGNASVYVKDDLQLSISSSYGQSKSSNRWYATLTFVDSRNE